MQAAAVPQPAPLVARLQQPVLAVPGQRPLIGGGNQPLQEHGHAEPLGDLPGPAAMLRRPPGITGIIPQGQGAGQAAEAMRQVGQGADLLLELNGLLEIPDRIPGLPQSGREQPEIVRYRPPGAVGTRPHHQPSLVWDQRLVDLRRGLGVARPRRPRAPGRPSPPASGARSWPAPGEEGVRARHLPQRSGRAIPASALPSPRTGDRAAAWPQLAAPPPRPPSQRSCPAPQPLTMPASR